VAQRSLGAARKAARALRSDLDEGASFNEFTIGDVVSFELLEDAVSGARALRVKRRRRQP
jgi:hypothetical protein